MRAKIELEGIVPLTFVGVERRTGLMGGSTFSKDYLLVEPRKDSKGDVVYHVRSHRDLASLVEGIADSESNGSRVSLDTPKGFARWTGLYATTEYRGLYTDERAEVERGLDLLRETLEKQPDQKKDEC